MSKMNPIHSCPECGVDVGHEGEIQLCFECHEHFFGGINPREDDELPEEVA